MVGKQVLTIDWRDFVRGMSQSDDMQDGGFSPRYISSSQNQSQMNLRLEPGILNGAPLAVDGDANVALVASIVVSGQDHALAFADDRLVVTSDGKYFRYNGTVIGSALQTDVTNTYSAEFSGMITFQQVSFVTSKQKVHKWSGTSTFDNNYDSFTFASTSDPHPCIVYEDNAYFADGNVLRRLSSASGSFSAVLTFADTSERITALGIDPSSGLLLIATQSGHNASDNIARDSKLHWYDGSSNKTSKVITVDDRIVGMVNVSSTVFVGYGTNIGYLSGSGIKFLRQLSEVSLADVQMPYQNRMCNIGNTLYVAERHRTLAFGEVLPGQRVWWYASSIILSGSQQNMTHIFNAGNNKLGVSFATNEFYTFDMDGAAGTLLFTSNMYFFPRPIIVKSVYIEYKDAVADANNNRALDLSVNGGITTFSMEVEGNTSNNIQNSTGGSIYSQEPIIGMEHAKGRTFQLKYSSNTVKMGVRRFVVYYDYAE